jgi:hypothetical protein
MTFDDDCPVLFTPLLSRFCRRTTINAELVKVGQQLAAVPAGRKN